MSEARPIPALTPALAPERAAQALPSVTAGALCAGCGGSFRPHRTTQRHCRPGCRVTALRRRRIDDLPSESKKPHQLEGEKAADSSQESAADMRNLGSLQDRTGDVP